MQVSFYTLDHALVDESVLGKVAFFTLFLNDGFEQHEYVLLLVAGQVRDDLPETHFVLLCNWFAILHRKVHL